MAHHHHNSLAGQTSAVPAAAAKTATAGTVAVCTAGPRLPTDRSDGTCVGRALDVRGADARLLLARAMTSALSDRSPSFQSVSNWNDANQRPRRSDTRQPRIPPTPGTAARRRTSPSSGTCIVARGRASKRRWLVIAN